MKPYKRDNPSQSPLPLKNIIISRSFTGERVGEKKQNQLYILTGRQRGGGGGSKWHDGPLPLAVRDLAKMANPNKLIRRIPIKFADENYWKLQIVETFHTIGVFSNNSNPRFEHGAIIIQLHDMSSATRPQAKRQIR